MTSLYGTTGRPVRVYDTSGALIWGTPDVSPVRRGITTGLWRTGRVTQERVPAVASTYMTAHRVRMGGTGVQITYGGYLPDGVSMDVACAVEVEGGTRVPATIGGASLVTMTGPEQVTTDALALTVAAGDVLRVYTYYGARSDGLNHPASPAHRSSNEILPGNQVASGEARTTGTYPGSAGYWSPGPHAITALTTDTAPSWALLGDSITESGSPGLAATGLATQSAARTWAHRALDTASPVMNAAMWGGSYAPDRAAHWATIPDLTPYTDAITAWGYNDLDQAWANSGRDVAYVQARAVACWTWVAAEGPHVWQPTVTPSTDSTDSWATVEGQTARASLPYRQEFNAWLRDGAPLADGVAAAVGATGVRVGEVGHPLAGILDPAARIETTPGSGIFRADHGPLTADGGHPGATGHDLMAQALT